MKFVNFVKYRDLDRVARARAAHFAYADQLRERGNLAIGGPLMDDASRRIGLLFVYEAVSPDEAVGFAREDPFALANALSSCEITEWRLEDVNVDLLIEANRIAHQSHGDKARTRLFAIYAKYAGYGSALAAARPAHWDYDRALASSGKLALAGPFARGEGALFVYNAADGIEALCDLEHDPFASDGVFADRQVHEWLIEGLNPTLLNPTANIG